MIRIAHLYPEQLNLYGDRGNIIVLSKRLEWRGIPFAIEAIRIGEHNKKLSDFDLFFIGGGQDRQQFTVAKDLLIRKNEIKDLVESNSPLLAVCGGYQLLGQSYQTSEGDEIEGLGILAIKTKAKPQEKNKRQDRLIGNVYAELLIDLNINYPFKTLVGFENHSGRTFITDSLTKPLAKIIKGFGNNAEDHYEGAVYKNIFGTYIHGSLLPKNPHLADEIIWRTLKNKNSDCLKEFSYLEKLNDELEIAAHNFAGNLK